MQNINTLEEAPSIIRQVCAKLMGCDTTPYELDLMISSGIYINAFTERNKTLNTTIVGRWYGYWRLDPVHIRGFLKNYLILGDSPTYLGQQIKRYRDILSPCPVPSLEWIRTQLIYNDEFSIGIVRLMFHQRMKFILPYPKHIAVWEECFGFDKNRVDYIRRRKYYNIDELVKSEYKKSPYPIQVNEI